MGTGWRRAFCTASIRRDPETTPTTMTSSSILLAEKKKKNQQERSEAQYSGSASSTPRCQAATAQADPDERELSSSRPKQLECKTRCRTKSAESDDAINSNWSSSSSKKSLLSPHSSFSPRSPSTFALLKAALRLSRNRCGVCGESTSRSRNQTTKTASVAVFTAECSHSFHFPCISTHVITHGSLVCPVCSAAWHDSIPFLSSSLHLHTSTPPAASAVDHQPPPQHPHHHHQHLPSPRSREIRGRQESDRAAPPPAGTTKIYDDDEPLQLSPTGHITTAPLQFNPIPEGLEAEEGEDGDGYTTHPGEHLQTGTPLNSTEALSVVPDSLALVSAGRNHLSYVISIKVKAPSLPPQNRLVGTPSGLVPPILSDHPSCRAPIDLVTVLDVSGGMTLAKLQMLKRAMRLVISSLGPGDRLCIVAFSVAAAKRLLPLRRMSKAGQRSARQIVDRLVICGSSQAQAQAQAQGPIHDSPSTSCVGDALRKATKVLEDRRERNPVATIMLLSEGHRHGQEQNACGTPMNTGSKTRAERQPSSSTTRFTHIEIPIQDSRREFQDMQQKQRTSSKMNSTIVMEEEEDAFAKRVNGWVSVVLQELRLQLTFPAACGEIFSVYSCSSYGDGFDQAMSHGEGGKSVFLGDMRAGEERQLLVELKVPKATIVTGHAAMSMSASYDYKDPLTQEVLRCGERSLVMPAAIPVQSQNGISNQPREMKNHRLPAAPMLFRSNSSCSSPTAAATSLFSAQQQQQQVLRNLFVSTRAMVESRRLVDIGDLDTAIHLLSSARSLVLQQSKADSVNTWKGLVLSLEARLEDIQRQQQQQQQNRRRQQQKQPQSPSQRRSEQPLLGEFRGGGSGDDQPLTPTSAWRAAEQLAKVAIMRKSLSRVSDLHGLENARF